MGLSIPGPSVRHAQARDGQLRQAELARRLNLEKSTTSRLVGQLAARDWVERLPAAEDGRGVVVRLTPAGKQAAERLAEARRARFKLRWTAFHPKNTTSCCAL